MNWPEVFRGCQEEVGEHADDFYRDAYRPQEVFYWAHLPKWMADDWAKKNPARVLDIGCGYGTLLLYAHRMTRCDALGIDVSAACLSYKLFEKWNLRFAISDIEAHPAPWGGPFDAIIMGEVIEHFRFHPVATMKKVRDLLASDGILYLSTPDAEEWGRTDKYKSFDEIPEAGETDRQSGPAWEHVWQYTKDELLGVLSKAGLQVVRFAYSPGTGGRHLNLTAMRTDR